MRIWAFHDAHNWGEMLHEAAVKRGHDAHLFDDPRAPDHGYVFMHMHHHPSVRLMHKRCMAIMAMNPDLTLIPDYRSSVLFDDKLEQARQLAKWIPRTRVFYTPGAARRFLESTPPLPFMSKALDGASSHNVRLVETYDAARLEVRQSFSDLGIKCRYAQAQRGYLLWQDYVAGNNGDIRVLAIGSKRLALKRSSEGGTRTLVPIAALDDPELVAAVCAADTFFKAEGMKWAGVDLVKDQSGRWFILECTVSWTMHGYYECAFLDLSGDSSGNCPKVMPIMGEQVWNVLLDELEAGAFK